MTKPVILAVFACAILGAVVLSIVLWAQNTHSQPVNVVPHPPPATATPVSAVEVSQAQPQSPVVIKPQVQKVSPPPSPTAVSPGSQVKPEEKEPERPLPPVTLINDKISIQSAVQEICYQAGLNYQWRRSHDATEPDCRRYVRVDLNRANLMSALDSIVKSNGLAYHIDGNDVWLERPE